MNDLYRIGIIYCGISILCAIIMFFNAKTVTEITSKYSISRYVFLSYLFAGIASIFDCAFTLRENVGIQFHPAFSYIFTIIYFLAIDLTGVFWIIYAEKKMNSWLCQNNKRLLIYMIPLFLLVLLTITTPFTKLYFYFEDNTYKRGSLFSIISILLFVYIIQSGIEAFIASIKKANYAERREYRRLVVYAFSYLLIQVLQLSLPDIFPYRSVGIMLIFSLFLNQNMKEMIGLDGLTHINNRYAVDRQLGILMSQNNSFELVLMDADKFKRINDEYGHVVGDKALQLIAEAIKEAVPKNAFFARWGGDEFVVINNDESHSIVDIEKTINDKLIVLTETHRFKCSITITAGYITKDNNVKSIPDLLKSVDNKLYERKKNKQKQHYFNNNDVHKVG